MNFQRLYKALCTNVLLPLGDALTHQSVMKQFAFLERAQWWDRERLKDLQNRLLRETIQTAYNETTFYKELYDKHGVGPNDIQTIKDLYKLPLVTKDLLRNAYPEKCTRKTRYKFREYHTSGSTGKPFIVRVDNHSLSIARALMLLRTTYAGWDIGERSLQTGMTLERGVVKTLKDLILRTKYVSAFNLSDKALDRYLEIIEANRYRYIQGYASSLYLLAKRAEAVGFNHTLNGAISWGDNMFPHYRNLIEKKFQCRVTDSYGCGEGIQVGVQCGHAAGGYHQFMPHVAVEFTKNGQSVAPWELGEILLTRLDPGAMPLIRYSVGDIGRADKKETCSCGRGLELMKSIEGRSADIILTPSGNRLIVHFFTGIFEFASTIDTFQVIQERLGEITVKIVVLENFQMSDWEKVKEEILAKGDHELTINMEVVKSIPLEASNKRRFVISRLKNQC